MARGVTIMVGVWALLAVPLLCMGGMIAHACDCEVDAECEHESTCCNDPCDEITIRNRSQRDVDVMIAAPAADCRFLGVDEDVLAGQSQKVGWPRPLRSNLPYHGSDIPLLI